MNREFSRPILFTRGSPAREGIPVADLAECAASIFEADGHTIFQYGHYSGYRPLREWLAGWLGVEYERILIGNGSMEFFSFLGSVLIRSGDTVFMENPTYDRAITAMKRTGARVVGIPLQEDGVDLDNLERQLQESVPRLFYIIPDFQNPSGVTTSLEKRRAIAELARHHGFMIVEDAPYRPLRYFGEESPSFKDLAPDQTIYISSFSKIVSPGMRVGFLVGPGELMPRLHKWSEDTYIHPSLVSEGIVYEYCRRGLLEPNIENLKSLYRPRLECVLGALERYLGGAQWFRTQGGFFLSVSLPPDTDGRVLMEQAEKFGLVLSDGRGFFTDGGGENFVRLPFCGLDPEDIDEGVRRLALAVEHCRI